MTREQYNKAERIQKERLYLQSMVQDVQSTKHFQQVKPNNTPGYRGIDWEMKPEYNDLVSWLKHRIIDLDREMERI